MTCDRLVPIERRGLYADGRTGRWFPVSHEAWLCICGAYVTENGCQNCDASDVTSRPLCLAGPKKEIK